MGCEFCGEEGHTINNCQLREAYDRKASAAQDLDDTAYSVQGTFDTPSCDGQILPLESAQDVAPPTHMPSPNSPIYTPTPDSPQYISDTPVNTLASPLYISDSPVYTPASTAIHTGFSVYTTSFTAIHIGFSHVHSGFAGLMRRMPHHITPPQLLFTGKESRMKICILFPPLRGLRRTGIAREYLKKYSHHP